MAGISGYIGLSVLPVNSGAIVGYKSKITSSHKQEACQTVGTEDKTTKSFSMLFTEHMMGSLSSKTEAII